MFSSFLTPIVPECPCKSYLILLTLAIWVLEDDRIITDGVKEEEIEGLIMWLGEIEREILTIMSINKTLP